MINYTIAITAIFGIMLAGIGVERLYIRFAERNPQLGPFRDSAKCGCCKAGSGCADTSCDDGHSISTILPRA